VRGWLILTFTLLTGVILGIGAATMGPALATRYLPKSISGQGERLQGEVLRKQREPNRLLLKVGTARGPMLVTGRAPGSRAPGRPARRTLSGTSRARPTARVRPE